MIIGNRGTDFHAAKWRVSHSPVLRPRFASLFDETDKVGPTPENSLTDLGLLQGREFIEGNVCVCYALSVEILDFLHLEAAQARDRWAIQQSS
jgi:hypothetical protein